MQTAFLARHLLPFLCLLAACGGSSGGGPGPGGGPPAPTRLAYPATLLWVPTDGNLASQTPTWSGGDPTGFSVSPALPTGLALDPATGEIAGATGKTLAPLTTYHVTASNAGGSTTADLSIGVGVLATLAPGFTARVVLDGLAIPNRFALAPDGRILFDELETGDVRVIRADGTLQATPFAHLDVLTGNYRGLLGLAIHPEFASNGWVYAMACVPGTGMDPDHQTVVRWTSVETSPGTWQGTNETTIVDPLPIGQLGNGGDIRFDLASPPHLFISVGDVDDEARSQEVGGLAGRILRYTEDGLVPADNPWAGDPTWCLGLRNTYGTAIQPTTGDLWGADNGPDANDHLDFLNKGKNFGWGGYPVGLPPGDVGIAVETWVNVIAPTSIAWHTGAGWGATYANNLFLSSYDDEAIRRFLLSGVAYLDVDEVQDFASFHPSMFDNKPLDLDFAADGTMFVSTFTGIYRIEKP